MADMADNKVMGSYVLVVLEELGRQPAVSFMEDKVAAAIRGIASRIGLPVHSDAFGNQWVTYTGPRSGDSSVPDIAFVAHMDHPGFEVMEQNGEGYVARALGGVPPAALSPRVALKVVPREGVHRRAVTSGRHGPEDDRCVVLQLDGSPELDLPAMAVLDLPDFQLADDLVHMRAADDLAGCAAILAAMSILASDTGEAGKSVGRVHGIFTRAEEVGLVGARLLAEASSLPKDSLVVSLEASRSLPGALIGDGPVIRVGDASFTFDASAESVLNRAREQMHEKHPDFLCQRQLMSGGTCEASAFIYHGYRATGIALPLGNYHNATAEGGIGPEFINTQDLQRAVELIVQAAASVGARHLSRSCQRMATVPQEFRGRLARQ